MLAYNFYIQQTWTPLLLDQKNQGGPEPLQGVPGPPQMAPLLDHGANIHGVVSET